MNRLARFISLMSIVLCSSCHHGGAGGGVTLDLTQDHLFKGTIAGGSHGTGICLFVFQSLGTGGTPTDGAVRSSFDMLGLPDMLSGLVDMAIAVPPNGDGGIGTPAFMVKGRIVTMTGVANLNGSADADGNMNIAGDGWSVMNGMLSGSTLSGDFADDKGGSGKLASEDVTMDDKAIARYCGSYAGDASGAWNFQIANGHLSGAFSGSDSGALSGSGSDSSASINFAGASAMGSATGTITSGAAMGTWSGTATSFLSGMPMPVMGTWMGGTGACVKAASGGGMGSHVDDGCCKPASGGRTACCIDTCPCG